MIEGLSQQLDAAGGHELLKARESIRSIGLELVEQHPAQTQGDLEPPIRPLDRLLEEAFSATRLRIARFVSSSKYDAPVPISKMRNGRSRKG